MRAALASLAVVMHLATSAMAEEVPPPKPPSFGEVTSESGSASDPVRIVRLGSFSAQFGKTRLEEIRQRIGSGQAAHAGDASEGLRWYCYSLPGQIVWFASGPMGGGERLTDVAAQSVEPSDPRRASCPPVPASVQPVQLQSGWLGVSRASLEQSLGKPSAVQGEWLAFSYSGKERRPHNGLGATPAVEAEFDVTSEVKVRFRGDQVVELHASRVTSN